jgi:hypothetical protein
MASKRAKPRYGENGEWLAGERYDKIIYLNGDVMTALKKDADRCQRSLASHIEAILIVYCGFDSVDLKSAAIEYAQRANSPSGSAQNPYDIGGEALPDTQDNKNNDSSDSENGSRDGKLRKIK